MAKTNHLGFSLPVNLGDKSDIFYNNFNKLLLVASSTFKWADLPNSVDIRQLETSLIYEGKIAFLRRNDMPRRPLVALPYVTTGRLDIYGNPIEYESYGIGFRQTCYPFNSVICYANPLRIPPIMFIRYYAYRLSCIEKAMYVNIGQQKHPILIRTTKKGELTAKNIFSSYDQDEETIIVYKDSGDFSPEDMKSLDLGVKEVYINLKVTYNQVFNDFLTVMGINNNNADKKERQIVPEVESNQDCITIYNDAGLRMRQDACKRVNEMFGTNISVDYTPRLEELINGNLYDTARDDMRNDGGERTDGDT